jgi:hypothetical protein
VILKREVVVVEVIRQLEVVEQLELVVQKQEQLI